MKSLVCLPTYNERENLDSLVEELLSTLSSDLLIVDDDSPDGTGQVAELLAKKNSRVSVLHRAGRRGLGYAYRAAFSAALERGYDQVFQMDADFSHQPRFLPKMEQALKSADLVVGSRYVSGGRVENWTLARRTLSRAGNAYGTAVLGMPYRDVTSGFCGYRRHTLEAIDFQSINFDEHAFQIELKYRAHRLGFTIVEVPIVYWDRVSGASKLKASALGAAASVLKLRMSR